MLFLCQELASEELYHPDHGQSDLATNRHGEPRAGGGGGGQGGQGGRGQEEEEQELLGGQVPSLMFCQV